MVMIMVLFLNGTISSASSTFSGDLRRLPCFMGAQFLSDLKQGDPNKSPSGSINQKYVYTYFMIKMRINSGSFELFLV